VRNATLLFGLVFLLAGCGSGSLTQKSLEQSAEAVQSSAAEAALVADGVADGRTTGPFVSVHAPELASAASKEATTLRSAQGPGELRAKADELARVADRVAKLADEIDGASETDARRLAEELRKEADRAKSIGGGG
jgi:hypothetical protein